MILVGLIFTVILEYGLWNYLDFVDGMLNVAEAGGLGFAVFVLIAVTFAENRNFIQLFLYVVLCYIMFATLFAACSALDLSWLILPGLAVALVLLLGKTLLRIKVKEWAYPVGVIAGIGLPALTYKLVPDFGIGMPTIQGQLVWGLVLLITLTLAYDGEEKDGAGSGDGIPGSSSKKEVSE